tara:strand:+ start:24 stop:578 length:555 start_codon:yes stop_codon:yes gene_type:complete
MSKIISNIDQLDEGGINPKSGVHEDKLWRLNFDDDSDPRILGRNKVLEYLTKGTVPPRTVHSFKRWILTTIQNNSIRTWVVVYDDKSHVQLINKDFYSLMTNGHRKKDEEKEEGERGSVSTAIVQAQQQAQEESQPSVTTAEEREKIDTFRNQVKEEKSSDSFYEEVRKDYAPHPDAKGLADIK